METASDFTHSNCSMTYNNTLCGSNIISLSGKCVPGILILMTYMDQNTPLLHFLSHSLALYLERIYYLLSGRVGHWQRVTEVGWGRQAESVLGNGMGRVGS